MRRQELADAAEDYVHDVLETYAPREDVYAEANGEYIREAPLTIGASTDAVIAEAKGRFLGVGAEQYQLSETEQSFERSTIGTMLVGMSEELVDQVNYAVMIDILIGRRLEQYDDSANAAEVDSALIDLQSDLGEMAYAAVCASALMRRHLQVLVEFGEYTPRSESDYVSQLSAECNEYPTPDTPAGLDEIVAAHRMDDDGAGD